MEGPEEAGLAAGSNVTTAENVTYPENNITYQEIPPLGAEAWVVPVLFVLIGVVGVGANGLVIYVSNKFKELKTATNRYIVSLAVTDLSFLLVCAPFTASLFATTSWALGKSMCKFVFYFMQVTVKAMCLTRCALTVDRYVAIVHPIASIGYRTPRFAVAVSACIWIVALLISTPLAVNLDLYQTEWHGTQTYCMERWPSHAGQITYWIATVLLTYALPLAVGIWSCIAVVEKLWGRNAVDVSAGSQIRKRILMKRRKVCLMITIMVLVFALCWLPTQILLLWQVIAKEDFPFTLVTFSWKIVALILTYLQSAISPIVYITFGRIFRKKMKQAFPRLFRSNRVKHAPLRAVAGGGLAAGRTAGTRRSNNAVLPSTSRHQPAGHDSDDVFGGVWNKKRTPVQLNNVAGTLVVPHNPRCPDVVHRQASSLQLTPRAPTITDDG